MDGITLTVEEAAWCHAWDQRRGPSWSVVFALWVFVGAGSRILMEVLSQRISLEPFSERQGSLWQNGGVSDVSTSTTPPPARSAVPPPTTSPAGSSTAT